MANLEVRVRSEEEARAIPFAEIPFRQDVIENVLNVIRSVGGTMFDLDLRSEADLTFQFAEDGEKAFLEVIISETDV